MPTLELYVGFVRRHALLLLVTMAAGLAGGLLLNQMHPATFTARASVLLAPLPTYAETDPTVDPRQVTIDTDAQLVRSQSTLARVANATDTTVATVGTHLSVSAQPLTRVLHIDFTSTDPRRAARGAQVAAEHVLALRASVLPGAPKENLEYVREALAAIRDEIQAQEGSAPDGLLQLRLTQMREFLRSIVHSTHATGEVLTRAATPTGRDSANREVAPASGVMLGLLAGVMIGAGRAGLAGRREA